jgi:hypothetical protein
MTTANHDQLGSRCKANIDQATRTAITRRSRRRLAAMQHSQDLPLDARSSIFVDRLTRRSDEAAGQMLIPAVR